MYAEHDARLSLPVPAVSLTLPDDHRDGFFSPTHFARSSTPPRPPSSSAPSSSPRTPSDRLFDDRRTLGGRSTTSAASSGPAASKYRSPAHSPSRSSFRSSRNSPDVLLDSLARRSRSPLSTRDLPPLPPSRASTPASHISVSSHVRSPLPNALPSSSQSPHQLAVQDPFPSKTSLVPSEGEDMDAFHVRNTYAQLEISGVKGDGYEDGIERTRARLHMSQANQLVDGNEKKGDLDPRELQTLASVDR